MTYIKKIVKSIAYFLLVALVTLSIYTFIMTDIMKKDYVNVFGYTYFVVSTGSMSGTIEVNDIIFVKVTDDVALNDVISYKNSDGDIITHRLISKVGNKYITQGDVNNVADDPINKSAIIGKVSTIISPTFILKVLAVFLILFIFFSLLNFDNVVKKYVVKDDDLNKKKNTNGDLPEDIFNSKKKKYAEKSTGLTVTIPLDEIASIQDDTEYEENDTDVEVLELEEVIDIDNNNIVTKELNSTKEKERALLDQVVNLLRVKNDTLTTARINKKWLTKYQYVYKLANIISLGDTNSLVDSVEHPTFKEIYDYDLEKAGLYENLRNKIYDMPIYIFLKILAYAVLYNDDEFFDGVFKIMKYKVQVDKNGYFRDVQRNDSYGKKQLKLLITFMKKISLKFDNKNVFELERVEKLAKLKSYANN